MKIQKNASAHWQGGLKDGKGTISTETGVLNKTPYSFTHRFEDGKGGTNPEELIAAAHAGCFSMALSAELGKVGITADSIETKAVVTLEKSDAGFSVTVIDLHLNLTAKGADRTKAEEAALNAKKGCPISKLMNATINLHATYMV